jgi:uncharacterized protein
MHAVLLADTHIRNANERPLDRRVLAAAAKADVILHAGDVTAHELLDVLSELAPVHAVLGNNDDVELAARLPEHLTLELDAVVVTLIHDGGPRRGRPARLTRRFPASDVIVFGHSHMPEDLTLDNGPRFFNPGSPTQRRLAPTRTFGLLTVGRGRLLDLRHIHLT